MKDIVKLARVLPAPYDHGPVRILFNFPLQLPVIALRAVSCRYELKKETPDCCCGWREIVIDPIDLTALTEKALDAHLRNLVEPLRPATKNRVPYFADVRASTCPNRSHNLWTASGWPAAAHHRAFQV